jgi:hypothetical protein
VSDDIGSDLSGRPRGPWDVTESLDEASAALGRLDLGALLVPGVPGMELRVETEEGTGTVTGATVVIADSAMQLSVFAAPRSSGIWQDVLGQLRSTLTSQGATSDVVAGEFGPEVTGRVGGQELRFIGINGPRWFLRAVLHGPAATEGSASEQMRTILRGCIVARDNTPMAPGDPLPLRISAEPGVTPSDGVGHHEPDAS